VIRTIDETQRKAARVVGFVYLFALVPAIFAEVFARGQLIVSDDAAETALNIVANERLFRLGIASNLTVFAADVILITALYVVLKPVNRSVALLAAGWGLIETAILVVVTLSDFDVLRILNGAGYLQAFTPAQLQALARLSIGAHGIAYNVGLVFSGLRGTVFCYLWFKSGFIPRPLAIWGVFSSLLLATSTFAFIIYPELEKFVTADYYGGPIFVFELMMGFWLLIKGLRPIATADPIGPP
jgi:Domain of unknown function (DUF4386)